MRERRDRAYGPYKHRDKFRVVVVRADGERITATFASETVARQRVDEVNAEAIGRTVNAAIDAFMATSTAKLRSKQTVEHRLRGILGERNRLLRKLTPQVARELFEARAVETSGDTQFHELASVRALMRWCIGRGWIRSDPFFGLVPTKPRKRGKPQLRIEEARKLLDVCLAEDSKAATAVALALLCGMRASSVTGRTVRDLDDGARVLWIENDKTDAGDRRLEVPEILRARLAALAAGRSGGARLFENTNRDWLRYHCRRLCKRAGIAVVSPHGLRGTHASLARPVVPVEHVARVLGHAGTAVTQRHYIAPGVESALDQRAVLFAIDGGRGKVA
jgi:integrase